MAELTKSLPDEIRTQRLPPPPATSLGSLVVSLRAALSAMSLATSALSAMFLATGALSACSGGPLVPESNLEPEVGLPSTESVPTPVDPKVRDGFAVYQAHCAACHGPRGEGEPDWKIPLDDGSLAAPPHSSFGHTWHHSDQELLRIIREGGIIYMPQSKMPGFAGALSDDEMRQVLDYVKTMWGPEERSYQAERSLDADMVQP